MLAISCAGDRGLDPGAPREAARVQRGDGKFALATWEA
jgi:hypothetical protein